MRYIGGKSRIARFLSPIILSTRPRFVVEPFCGALNISLRLVKDDPTVVVYASDSHSDLVSMWQAVKDGWSPPDSVSRDEYDRLREEASSPLRTFVGYGCSFSGKWFGGYASDPTGRNYAANARNSIERTRPLLERIVLGCSDYTQHVVPTEDYVIYCDPPYANTTKPGERQAFDHTAFWQWVNTREVPCYVSEYEAPADTCAVWQRDVKTDMHTTSGKAQRVEKLFVNLTS